MAGQDGPKRRPFCPTAVVELRSIEANIGSIAAGRAIEHDEVSRAELRCTIRSAGFEWR